MKRNFKRWMALLLALALFATTGIYSSHSWLRANEEEQMAASGGVEVQNNEETSTTSEPVEVQQNTNQVQEVELPPPAPEPVPTPGPPAPETVPTPEPEPGPPANEEEVKSVSDTPENVLSGPYTITFDSNDQRGFSYTIGATSEPTFTFPDLATTKWKERKGYELTGWKKNGEDHVYRVGETGTTGDHTYFAVWEEVEKEAEKEKGPQLVLDANNGTNAQHKGTLDKSTFIFPSAEELNWTNEGYEFLGWSKHKNDAAPTYLAGDKMQPNEKDTQYFAIWKKIKTEVEIEYTITFDANGGTGSYTLKTQNKSFIFPDSTESGITRSGYEFEGWAASSTGSVEYTAGQKETVAQDTTYYAVWKKVNPIITFEPNGGTGKAFTIVAVDGSFVYPDNNDYGITREGYTFIGWSKSKNGTGTCYIPNIQQTGIEEDTTYYAIWMDENANGEVKTQFFVRKDGEIKLEPAKYPNAQYYKAGTGTLKQGIAINNNLSAVAANIKTAPSDETLQSAIPNFDPSTDKVIWYVIKMENDGWHVDGVVQKKDLYTVTYYPNGGSTNNVPGAKQYPAGKTVNVEVNTYPSREGYTFIGWDENPHVSLDDVQYPKGQSSSFEMPNKNVYLYAIWSPNEATAYKVEHYLEQADGTFTLHKTSDKAGRTGETVSARAESFAGYAFDSNNTNNVITGVVEADGSLVLKLYYKVIHKVTYVWSGLPKETLYNADGTKAELQLPDEIENLKSGDRYTIDSKMPGTVVYTHDEYGNKTTKYTLGMWADPNNGVMGGADITVKAVWKPVELKVNTYGITYEWSGDVPKGDYAQKLPTDTTVYKNNQPYTVDKKFKNGYTVTTYTENNNVSGVYTFSGWDTADGNITDNLTIKGTWTFTETEVAKHNVSYQWTGLPEDTVLYDEDGSVVNLSVPGSITNLENNQKYEVDRSQEGTVVYTHDEYGNINASYTLGTWNDPNNEVMGDKDVLVTAEWAKADVSVSTWGITYNWSGDVPEGAYAQKLPTDITEYKNNQPYAVDKTFTNGYTVTTYDEYDNVNGQYVFSGWNKVDGRITENLTIEGTWVFTETEVEAHNVIYEWSGLPENTALYDEAGNAAAPGVPASITGLVKGQSYEIDTRMPGTVVYTRDEDGNVNAKYTLGAWDKTSGKMEESDIIVKAEWTKEEIAVERLYNLTIHYVDTEGNTVADDYTAKLAEGEAFTVESPEVDGFTPNYATISSDEEGMPARDLTFTVIYVANELVTPGTPGLPGLIPETPAVVTPGVTVPGTPAAIAEVTPGAPLVFIPQAETPLAVDAVVAPDEEGDYTLTSMQDQKTPLANKNLEDHDCCIFHFLVMILALIAMGLYTRSMKKRQAKIFELRENLETEKARRGGV